MNVDRQEITRIWLIRHGEPTPESRGRCYGRLDVGLSPAGYQQVRSVGERLCEEPISAIYASPRKRTTESAELLAQRRSCSVVIEERLREIDFGDFEGKRYEEIAQTHPEIYRQWMEHPTETKFPNGEDFRQMQKRVLESAHEIYDRHRGDTIAIISHGGVNRILLAEALGVSAANIFRIAQRYASLNLLTLIGEYASVELMNA